MNRRTFLRGLLVTSALTAAPRAVLPLVSAPAEDFLHVVEGEGYAASIDLLTRQIAIACGIPHSILVGERLQPVNVYDALLPHQDPYATRQFSDFVRAMWDREADHV